MKYWFRDIIPAAAACCCKLLHGIKHNVLPDTWRIDAV